MSAHHGSFVWHELMTTDMAAAKAFYTNLAGWTCKDMQMPDMDYWVFSADDKMAAGLMNIPPEAKAHGAPPNWSGTIAVDDIDALIAKLKAHGGKVMREPADIPNIGRFAVVTDPQGAYFQIIQPAGPPPANPPGQNDHGQFGWNELYALDMQNVFPVYADLFGWTKGEAINMGEMGTYQLFHHGGVAIGGMMTKPPQMPVAAWTYYINIPDIDAAAAKFTSSGGAIFHGPAEVPRGMWIAQGRDPQGAVIAIVGKRG